MKTTFWIVALGITLCIPASASTKAQLLQETCQADDRLDAARAANDESHLKPTDPQGSAFCLGFITGWAQTIDGLAVFEANADATWFSFPNGLNVQQGKKVFLQYIADHPERQDQPAILVLRIALSEKNILEKHLVPLSKSGIEVVPPTKK
jgi:hypothetical protein